MLSLRPCQELENEWKVNVSLDSRLITPEIGFMRTPLLARLTLFAFVWVGLYGGTYILFDSFGLWARLSESFTHALDILTAAILLTALAAHLLVSTGRLPEHP